MKKKFFLLSIVAVLFTLLLLPLGTNPSLAKRGGGFGGGARVSAPASHSFSAPKATPSGKNSQATAREKLNQEKTVDNKTQSQARPQSAANTAAAPSHSRFGGMMRSIGLFAGGMFLGSMLSHALGFGAGFGADILGLLINLLLILIIIRLALSIWRKLRRK